MVSDKGYLKDADKFTQEHQQMSMWFTVQKNARDFVRMFLCDLPLDLTTTLEVPVKSSTGFLYGYADVVMSYRTDQFSVENVLIELKSSLTDFGAVLRQIRTYQEYLRNVTKTCLIHSGLDDRTDDTATRYFVSQGIYVSLLVAAQEIMQIGMDYKVGCVPAGKRLATLIGVFFSTKRDHWSLAFIVEFQDEKLGRVSDLLNTGNYFTHKEEFWKIIDKFELNIDKTAPQSRRGGELDIPCEVDLAYRPGEIGTPEAVIERIYVGGEAIEVLPDVSWLQR